MIFFIAFAALFSLAALVYLYGMAVDKVFIVMKWYIILYFLTWCVVLTADFLGDRI